MEPQIRYVRSADGTNIAYSTVGEGTPLVWSTSPTAIQTIGIDWQIPRARRSLLRLAENRTVVRVEPRGRGLSDHEVTDRSLDAFVSDVDAIVSRLGAPVDLVSDGTAAIGIAYAARHPDRVRKLVLLSGLPRGFGVSPLRQALRAVAEIDFEVSLQMVALLNYGWDDGKTMAGLIENLTREEMTAGMHAVREFDATADVSAVVCPTLVVHLRGIREVPLSEMRKLAASIDGAQIRVLETKGFTYMDEDGLVAEAIIEFLDIDEVGSTQTDLRSGTASSVTSIILFADIADSTALTERLGDAAFREKARVLDDALRSAIREQGGTVIEGKLLGDGILATFSAASQAIAAALNLEAAASPTGLGLHVGLHAGDVIRESDNVFGGAVNIASRISALAPPGEVFVSRTVADLARTSAGVTFEDRGEHALKGIAEPQRVFAVRASEAS